MQKKTHRDRESVRAFNGTRENKPKMQPDAFRGVSFLRPETTTSIGRSSIYWARSIMDSEQNIPDWLAIKLDEMCPGFLEAEKQHSAKHPEEAVLVSVRLGEWIDKHIVGFAEQTGWLRAITFYAVRESRYQKASVCWSESSENGGTQNHRNILP